MDLCRTDGHSERTLAGAAASGRRIFPLEYVSSRTASMELRSYHPGVALPHRFLLPFSFQFGRHAHVVSRCEVLFSLDSEALPGRERSHVSVAGPRSARSVLEYAPDAHVDPCFFSHVHARNMRRVMHDLADVVCRGKQRVQWLVRLRTGNERWRWYRAFVRNRLGRVEDCILVRLRPL